MTAYCTTFLACYNPATSSHLTLGFYLTIASDICPSNSFCSAFLYTSYFLGIVVLFCCGCTFRFGLGSLTVLSLFVELNFCYSAAIVARMFLNSFYKSGSFLEIYAT
jgi:hypothetical protein